MVTKDVKRPRCIQKYDKTNRKRHAPKIKKSIDELMDSINPLASTACIDYYGFIKNDYRLDLEDKILTLEKITGMSIDTLIEKLLSGELKIQKDSIYPRVDLSTILGTKDD